MKKETRDAYVEALREGKVGDALIKDQKMGEFCIVVKNYETGLSQELH